MLYSSVERSQILLSGDYIWLTHSELHTSLIKRGNLLKLSDSSNDTNGI